jgi:hypothetical protein
MLFAISGGKVLHTKSRRVLSRVATALRMAANSLHHAKVGFAIVIPRGISTGPRFCAAAEFGSP